MKTTKLIYIRAGTRELKKGNDVTQVVVNKIVGMKVSLTMLAVWAMAPTNPIT